MLSWLAIHFPVLLNDLPDDRRKEFSLALLTSDAWLFKIILGNFWIFTSSGVSEISLVGHWCQWACSCFRLLLCNAATIIIFHCWKCILGESCFGNVSSFIIGCIRFVLRLLIHCYYWGPNFMFSLHPAHTHVTSLLIIRSVILLFANTFMPACWVVAWLSQQHICTIRFSTCMFSLTVG